MAEYLWKNEQIDNQKLQEFIKQAKVTRPIALALMRIGVEIDKVAEFLNPSLSHLSDPYLLSGTKDAAKRMWQAIQDGEKILIYGDYDTDGVTASALMSWTLRQNGGFVDVFLPHRIDDGYGLTVDSIKKAVEDGYKLVITVDCGVTCYDAVKYASQNGLDIIITDHHMPGNEELENSIAVVDPKMPGNPEYLYNLAGVGVAFKTCHAFLKYGREQEFCGNETDLKDVLDLVALGTVADIVPLNTENRILVRHGLRILSEKRRPGIHALCEICNIRAPIFAQDITFRLAPRLNAAGRMGNPSDSLRLLEAESMDEAWKMAEKLKEYNVLRQQEEEFAIAEAEVQIAERYPNLDEERTIVVCQLHWHQGILGILASRLARKYNRPCVVLASDGNGTLNGSGRSIADIDLVDVLGYCDHLLERFGGHAMAAGLSLLETKLEEFRVAFEEAMIHASQIIPEKTPLTIFGDVSFSELNSQFFKEFELLEPIGHDNPVPAFCTCAVTVTRISPMGQNHCRGVMVDRSGAHFAFVAFNVDYTSIPKHISELVYNPHINLVNGKQNYQIRIVDFKIDE